jgi:hypothetical protein
LSGILRIFLASCVTTTKKCMNTGQDTNLINLVQTIMPEPCLRRRFDAANELDSRIRCPLSCSLQTCPTLRHSDFHSQSHPIINRPPCRWSSAIEGISRRPKGGIAYLVRITNPVSSQASSLCKSTLISTSNDEESLKLPHS